MSLLYALGGIVIIATAYEVNKTLGLGLFVLAIMAMVATYFKTHSLSY